jgi:hypothetical protein
LALAASLAWPLVVYSEAHSSDFTSRDKYTEYRLDPVSSLFGQKLVDSRHFKSIVPETMRSVAISSLIAGAAAKAAVHHETGTFAESEFKSLGFAGKDEVRGAYLWVLSSSKTS